MTTERYFHFTLGPVQAFVAQARRTRDFWAGSFVLSWLSAVAMKTVQKLAGDEDCIEFPIPDIDFLNAIEKGAEKGKEPKQGNIPNRFMARVPESFKIEQAREVERAVQTAWKAVADKVWTMDFAGHLSGEQLTKTDMIWKRQIPAFWDMQWIFTESKADTGALDRRKNWRSHALPEEGGVKCGMMDGWQELSGVHKPNKNLSKVFWENLRAKATHGIRSDLRPEEELCAIAYVKRRFVRCFEEITMPLPGGWVAHGWKLPPAQPSTYYLAAAPWLAQVIEHADPSAIVDFYKAARDLDVERGEWNNEVHCVKEARKSYGHRLRKLEDGKYFASLDGAVFFEHALENEDLFPSRDKVPAVRDALKALSRSSKAANLDPPSPFYAVLLMDGDSLGKHMSDEDKQPVISKALQQFTLDAATIVQRQSGFLVYAGGDDVLAVLPLEFALPCALELRKAYTRHFDEAKKSPGFPDDKDFTATLSGAVEFAHVKMPLGRVLADAHHLLVKVAKDATGRDAIACRVWKPGGQAMQWSMPWEIAAKAGAVQVVELSKEFQRRDTDGTPMANGFFYRIRERLELLNPDPRDPKATPVLPPAQARSLMAMEYLNSGLAEKGLKQADAEDRIAPLLEQCRPHVRKVDVQGEASLIDSHRHTVDGALLVRFLAQKGVETR